MQTHLDELRRQLGGLGRRRRINRWNSAFCAFLAALSWLLICVFAVDLFFLTDITQRLVLIAIAGSVLWWVCARFAWPLMAVREREFDLVLMVEKQHQVDNDLVAALQFGRADAAAWGSSLLRNAVVRKAAEFAAGTDVSQAIPLPPIGCRLYLVIAGLVLAMLITVSVPDYVAVFLQRLALGSQHYPARTVIDEITVNSQVVVASQRDVVPGVARCPEGSLIEIRIRCSGDVPENGELEIIGVTSGDELRIKLNRMHGSGPAGERAGGWAVFGTDLPGRKESLRYRVSLGDAWTDIGLIEIDRLPDVELWVRADPPNYTNSPDVHQMLGSETVFLLEGSSVELEIRCINGKRLVEVVAVVRGEEDEWRAEFGFEDDSRLRWRCSAEQVLCLKSLGERLECEILVTDIDGLSTEADVVGRIDVRPDELPVIDISTACDVVVADAVPQIDFQIDDDFGIAEAMLGIETARLQAMASANESSSPSPKITSESSRRLDIGRMPVSFWNNPSDDTRPFGDAGKVLQSGGDSGDGVGAVTAERKSQSNAIGLPIVGNTRVELASENLLVGDTVTFVIAATDFRGRFEGRGSNSQPVLIRIGNRHEVVERILRSDSQTVETLDELIRRQLVVGSETNSRLAEDEQRAILTRTRRLVSQVLNQQLQSLRDNHLEGLLAFGDIKATAVALMDLVNGQMNELVQQLDQGPAAGESREQADLNIQELVREVVHVLKIERSRVQERLRVADLVTQIRTLMTEEERIREATRGLRENTNNHRQQTQAEVLVDQQDVRTLFDRLLRSLADAAEREGGASAPVVGAKDRLDRPAVKTLFSETEQHLDIGDFSAAIDGQSRILRELSAALEHFERHHGANDEDRSKLIDAVEEIRKRQEELLRDTKSTARTDQQAMDTLTDLQGEVRADLESLGESQDEEQGAKALLSAAESAASGAEERLFERDLNRAESLQDRVVQSLAELEKQLRSANGTDPTSRRDRLIDQIQDLEQLESALEQLGEKQVEAAEENSRAAASLEKSIADELARQAGREAIPENVEREVRKAASAASDAAKTLGQEPESSDAGRQAMMQAQTALQRASETASSALAEARSRQRGPTPDNVEPRDTGEMADSGMETGRSRPGAEKSSSEGTMSGQEAPGQEGRRITGDQGRKTRDGMSSRGPVFDGRPWFADLPPELRDAIHSRVRQTPPRGYEKRLRQYFESNED